MIVRRHFITVITILLTFWAHNVSTKGERWSRQVLNSEWIPLANPRSLQLGTGVNSGVGNQAQALPPVLREQYQQQLLQLQETQESIQKLLQLQQQLRAQQQLLQAQSYVPESFTNDEERKSALAHSAIANLQTLPQLAPGALLPPPPADQPQLPEFTAQNFLVRNPQEQRQESHGAEEQNREQTQENSSVIDQEKAKDQSNRQGNYKSAKQLRDSQAPQQFISQTTQSSLQEDNQGEEEVQLLYVPAETLAQRDPNQKSQRVRNRKQFSSQQQQQQQSRQQTRYQQQGDDLGNQGLEGTRPSTAQQAFAQRVLYQLQQDEAERTRIQQEEREKEIARLRDEQKELDRQAKFHEELVAKEKELKRQKEIELRKELERQEEAARQKELERIRAEEAARKEEAERQLIFERQKIAEIRARSEAEARQAEIDRLAALERQKEAEIQEAIKQQQEIERQQAEEEAHRQAHQENIEKQKQAQIDAATLDARNRAQNQAQQQHLTETTRPKGNRPRPRKQPPPNQPPLSVYMARNSHVTNPDDLRVSDVLTILKDAKTISVLETVGQNIPQVFVGPTSLEPPSGYAKFELPYLSAIDNNRVERKVDKLPFFVAPLSFKPPPGYSKIPFPAPHIGSVVINTLDNGLESLDGRKTEQALRPVIEPNSYQGDVPARNLFAPQATPDYSQDGFVSSTTPRYEATYQSTPASPGTRYRHRQFYNDRNQHVASTPQYEEQTTTETGLGTRTKFRQYFKEEQVTPQSQYQETTPGQEQNAGGRLNPVVQGEQQTYQNLNQAYVTSQLQYPVNEQTVRPELVAPHQTEETRASPEPSQYTISSELPKIHPQLPGLVNSLIEQEEQITKTVPTTTTPPTTTTTTTETPTSTYRTRGRQRGRVIPTRAPTTTENVPTKSSVTERPRRPYSRSRVRQGYATTTETYHETIHDTPRTKFSGTDEKSHFTANEQPQRRPVQRTQRYRGRGGDKNAVQPEARPELDGNYPTKHSLQGPSAIQNSNAPVYHEEATVPSATPQLDDSRRPIAQPLQGVSEAAVTLEPEANYPTNFGQTRVEQSPVNGFNYQSQNEKLPDAVVQHQYQTANSFDHQRPQSPEQIYDFNGKQAPSSPGTVNVNNFHNTDANRQLYGSHTQGSQNSFQDTDSLKISEQQPIAPVFDHPEDHLIQAPQNPTTETPEPTTPRPTLTPAPLTVRHRIRSRPQRPHADAPIQTRPTGSRDEFVRFSAVNQDNVRQHSSGRIQTGSRQRQRNRQGSQASVQTEGNDFVRLGSPAQRTTTTTTTTQTPQKESEDIEYGFIRPPSFKPIHPVGDRHAGADVAPTYRPKYEQIQNEEPTNDAPVEVNTPQSQILKNRQKYHVMNRRPLTRSTAAPEQLTTTSAQPPIQEEVYTVKPFVRDDDSQGVRTRGRVRRPGKRRTTTTSTTTTTTTTTTESILDSSNELPHEENYPQIIQGVAANPPDAPRRTLFDEELKSPHLETLPQAEALQRPVQLHSFQHQDNPHFAGHDFVLNFGLDADHEDAHDQEYDQTQIASSTHNQRKYNHINRANFHPRPGINPVADIEGAESQWSTKLTHSSFQPSSLVNQVPGGGKNSERHDKSDDSFDIITAGPELASVDVLVTSNSTHEPRDIVVNTSYLGNAKKEGLEIKEPRRRPVLEGRAIVERKNDTFEVENSTLDKLQFWNNGEDKETIVNIEEPEKTQLKPDVFTTTPKISEDATNIPSENIEAEEPTTTKRTVQRRRRIRVRVRPADDFVSAESQHVGSTWNSLVREKQNYDKTSRVEDFKTTIVPSTSSTTEATSVKTFLEELFEEMTKDSEAKATLTTTNTPEVNQTTTIEGRTEVPEATTTPSFSGDFSTTSVPNVVTDVTTAKNPEALSESLEKAKETESILQEHKFRPKHPHTSWWKHNFETVTETPKSEPDGDLTVTSTAAADPEGTTSEATTTTIAQGKDSSSEHSLSDYMDAFFGTVPKAGDHEEEKTDVAIEGSESSGAKMEEEKETDTAFKVLSEETKSNVSGSAEPEAVKEAEKVAEEFQKMTNTQDSTTIKAAEEIATTLGQETTTIFVPQTTPEVPLSPEELTTEIPSITTTPNTSPNNQMAKVLRTSTTTQVSHMTEICYRGRCVKTKSRKEVKRK